ncbi:F-box protein At3g59000-like [Zingiber officinale]|uniref:F-box protein At3g59000-like n=1 Tax=Zingiber officinale TaxID=94328 RepID=UPI001C4C9D09|nr:F-box protein At3g59000-like [Zingiber officinale]
MTDRYKRRREQASAPEDRLTSLHEDLLNSILSFLSIKQRVALSAVCSRFRRLLPFIPRLDAFHLDVGLKEVTFPRALIRQCHVVVFLDGADLPKPLMQFIIFNLAEAGVQDLILGTSVFRGWMNVSGRDCGLFGIKSLRSLSLNNTRVSKFSDRRPLSPLGCALLTSLKMELCFLRHDFLSNLLASCPLLETLQLIFCYGLVDGAGRLSIHSASIKHLVLFYMIPSIAAIDIQGPKLESLVVEVVPELHIEAPKIRNASFFLDHDLPEDPPVALMNLFRAASPHGVAWLVLNSSRTPNGLAAQNAIDEFIYHQFICPKYKTKVMIFNLDFNLKDQSSTMILTQLLKKCNDNARFDIRADSTHIESTIENNHFVRGSTGVELIELRMKTFEETFEEFFLNQKEMAEELKEMGLQWLRSRTSREQFEDILASEESLYQVSPDIDNCIEMKI